jgi:hypothetical protein
MASVSSTCLGRLTAAALSENLGPCLLDGAGAWYLGSSEGTISPACSSRAACTSGVKRPVYRSRLHAGLDSVRHCNCWSEALGSS